MQAEKEKERLAEQRRKEKEQAAKLDKWNGSRRAAPKLPGADKGESSKTTAKLVPRTTEQAATLFPPIVQVPSPRNNDDISSNPPSNDSRSSSPSENSEDADADF